MAIGIATNVITTFQAEIPSMGLSEGERSCMCLVVCRKDNHGEAALAIELTEGMLFVRGGFCIAVSLCVDCSGPSFGIYVLGSAVCRGSACAVVSGQAD